MSGKKQRRLPEIGGKREKKGGKKVHAGDVCILLTSHVSKPVGHGCTLPDTGNGGLMKQNTGNIKHTGRGEQVSTHFPPLPVKAVAQQQVKKLSERSSASRHGFDCLPMLHAVVMQDYDNKKSSQLKRDRLTPVRLLPIKNETQSSSSSSWSARHTELNNFCKLPDISNAHVVHSRPKSETRHRLSCAGKEELDKKPTLPPIASVQRAASPRIDKAKKKKMIV